MFELFNFPENSAFNLRSGAYYRRPLLHAAQYYTESIKNLKEKNGT